MKWIDRLKKLIIMLMCVSMLAGMSCVAAFAAEPGSILSKWVSENQVVLILRDTGTEDIHVQIGNTQCSDMQVTDAGSEPMETLILVDNSESIAEKYRPVIRELLTGIVGSKGGNETVSIATFTDRQSVLIENSGDYSALMKAVDSITYDSHDAWLVPVLFDVLSSWQQDSNPVFRRIIVISDGASEERTGYTMEELNRLLQDYPCPIYTIGADHKSNDNKEELNRLFSLSRLTKGDGWLLADISDPLEVASVIAEEGKTQMVTISPPPELCDGTERGIQVEANGSRDQTTIMMPFQELTDITEAPSEEETEEPVSELSQETTTEEVQEEKSEENSWLTPVIAIVLIAGAIAAAVILVVRSRKQNPHKPQKQEKHLLELDEKKLEPENDAADDDNTEDADRFDDKTEDAFPPTDVPFSNRTPKLVLTDINDPNQRFTAAMRGTIMVGRPDSRNKTIGSKIVIKDKSVSRSHCTFRCDKGRLYLSDTGSKNGTIVNGDTIVKETEVYDGNIITLGNVDLRIEIQR